ncbi:MULTISPECIES: DUF1993 family protein [unclassified Methylophilus]|uniref:DUF1993 domain-containing protein n=1 Tax=unclassified Methylophilus TaxID=2630143 RepID=UPI00070184C5|nr:MULTISPECIES: DUF1993 domain-containing protein [unclassified Methylophilus]KQT41267.1 hypothetical protein ASG34_10975 [Methylophilus sp. Leaf416]KQT57789.1 hypothetical protein ASG44_12575 [Methylophilus sp. Leaf459]
MHLYDVSIAPLVRNLQNLKHILQQGELYAEQKKVEPEVILNSRLSIDMYPLTRQVQLVSDMSKGAGARLAGLEIPQYADDETSFEMLYARIDKTINFLSQIQPTQLEGAESKEVVLTIRKIDLTFTGLDYLQKWAMPNVYFHITTAYNILRHIGVPLGKTDYLGQKR